MRIPSKHQINASALVDAIKAGKDYTAPHGHDDVRYNHEFREVTFRGMPIARRPTEGGPWQFCVHDVRDLDVRQYIGDVSRAFGRVKAMRMQDNRLYFMGFRVFPGKWFTEPQLRNGTK